MSQIINRKGFTLIEVMVVMGIMAIMITGFMQFMDYQRRAVKGNEVNAETVQVRTWVDSWLTSQSICDENFRGLRNTDTTPITNIRRSPTDVMFQLGDRIPGTNWTVTQMRLLSRQESLQVQPTFSVGLDSEGVGVALFEVRIRQMQAGSNTQTVVDGQDRGNYAVAEKVLHFPIRARFAEMFVVNQVNTEQGDFFTPTNQVAFCGLDNTTITSSLAQQGVVTPSTFAMLTANGEQVNLPNVLPNGIVTYLHLAQCYAFNIDLPIQRCLPPGASTALGAN